MEQTKTISMRQINDWLDDRVVKLGSDPHVHRLPLEYYYTSSELKRFVDPETKKIQIDERTRRNDASNIFCELVDYCVKFEINDLDGSPLFNPSNKNSFYDFVYSNSSK